MILTEASSRKAGHAVLLMYNGVGNVDELILVERVRAASDVCN